MRGGPGIAQTLALIVGTLAFVALVGYWYRVQELYSVAQYTGIAWPTAAALEVLSVGILTANADVGPASVLLSARSRRHPRATVDSSRHLIPPALGYLRVVGQQAGIYDTGMGTALLVVVLACCSPFSSGRTAVSLDATDRARAAVARRARRSALPRTSGAGKRPNARTD